MNSMTGHGSGVVRTPAGHRIHAEISSVNNRKGFDLVLRLPEELLAAEADLREILSQVMTRGRLTAQVRLEARARANRTALDIDLTCLRQYARQCQAAARTAGLPSDVSLEFLLRLPGVLKSTLSADPALLHAAARSALERAIAAFQKSRAREGAFLARDLTRRLEVIARHARAIHRRKPHHLRAQHQTLHARLKSAGLDLPLDDERLLKELAFFADRCDISEELTRLAAHLTEGRRLLRAPDSTGRTLEFLLQEIGREINTIGSKANDLTITRHVLAMKSELEKIREQVQNLE